MAELFRSGGNGGGNGVGHASPAATAEGLNATHTLKK